MEETPSEFTEMAGALAKIVGAIVMYYAFLEHWIDIGKRAMRLCPHCPFPLIP
jgi:hypothetical protein